jgi:hypothetical protein
MGIGRASTEIEGQRIKNRTHVISLDCRRRGELMDNTYISLVTSYTYPSRFLSVGLAIQVYVLMIHSTFGSISVQKLKMNSQFGVYFSAYQVTRALYQPGSLQ